MKLTTITESWCKLYNKDLNEEILRYTAIGYKVYRTILNTSEGTQIILYLPENKDLETQAAYPTELKMSSSADKGLTKYELVLKDFTTALLSNPNFVSGRNYSPSDAKTLVQIAEAYTNKYFFILKTKE